VNAALLLSGKAGDSQIPLIIPAAADAAAFGSLAVSGAANFGSAAGWLADIIDGLVSSLKTILDQGIEIFRKFMEFLKKLRLRRRGGNIS
jgi:hypothetical protein